MIKTMFAVAAAFAAVSSGAYAGPIHTQTSVQEIVVVAYDKEPLSSRYQANITHSLAVMDIRLRTELAVASYQKNEADLAVSLQGISDATLVFVGS